MPTAAPSRAGLGRILSGLVRLRCPRCFTGKLYRGLFAMNDPCPVCGLVIEREQGYFLGSMYVSYGLACLLIGVGYFVVAWFLPDWHELAILGLVVAPYFVLAPLVVR